MKSTVSTPVFATRLFLEGVVIVLSILLAFAIDAWWMERQSRDLGIQKLTRVSGELALNESMLREKIPALETAMRGVRDYQSWMGPSPAAVDSDLFASKWGEILGIGTFSMVRRAIDEYLAQANYSSEDLLEIHSKLADWYHHADLVENQYRILREDHLELRQYLNRLPQAPLLATLPEGVYSGGINGSAFPFEQKVLLNDPVLESLLATYLIRLGFVAELARDYLDRQRELSQSISALLTSP